MSWSVNAGGGISAMPGTRKSFVQQLKTGTPAEVVAPLLTSASSSQTAQQPASAENPAALCAAFVRPATKQGQLVEQQLFSSARFFLVRGVEKRADTRLMQRTDLSDQRDQRRDPT